MSSEKADTQRSASPALVADPAPTAVNSAQASIHSEKGQEKSSGEVTREDEKVEAGDDDDVEYPTGLKLVLISLGLAMVTFVVALDNTIIATAIPKITEIFNSLNDVGWYGSSYLLTMTSLQPSFGKIYANFDIKIVYLVSLFIFEIGSVICAAARNSAMLIVGRAIAGIGASALFSGAMIIVTYTVPLQKRPLYIAVLSSMFGIASVVGPLLGGAFTDKLSWRWCFWINLPFGGFTAVVLVLFLSSPRRKKTQKLTVKEKLSQIDVLGALFLISGITCLLLALQWGGSTYPWKSPKIYGLFIGFALIIAIFIAIQFKRQDLATIPPRTLRQRTVLVSGLFSALFSMAMYTHIFYLPFYFQAIKGTTAVGSGIRTIPYLVSITIASLFIGGFITVTGVYHYFLWIGAAIFVVGCGMIHTLDVDSKIGAWFGYQVLAGIGGGSVQVPFLAVQAALSAADIPIGTSIIMFFNSLGGAISISIAQNIFSNQLVTHVIQEAPSVNPLAVIHAGATGLRNEALVPASVLPSVLIAYAKSLQTVFIPPIAFGGLAFIVSLFIERINVKGKKLEVAPGA